MQTYVSREKCIRVKYSPRRVPPFSPRFTYLRHSIFPNACEWKVRAKILHFVAKQVFFLPFIRKKEKYRRINRRLSGIEERNELGKLLKSIETVFRLITSLFCVNNHGWIKINTNFTTGKRYVFNRCLILILWLTNKRFVLIERCNPFAMMNFKGRMILLGTMSSDCCD